MTDKQIQQAAQSLLKTRGLPGEGLVLPKAYIVKGKCYWFLNVAKRAAFGAKHPAIYVLTAERAMQIAKPVKRPHIASFFDQTGSTYDGRLFDDHGSPLAFTVDIPQIII
ncbi:MAG: hypothetical protein IJP45_03970 [Paludibacteraceae bacterium]|nr:hypothetical protein [Paludibacteraceae bacterium]